MKYPLYSPDSFGQEQDKDKYYPAIPKIADPGALMSLYCEQLDHFSALFAPGTDKVLIHWIFDQLFNAMFFTSEFGLKFKKRQPWEMN